MHALRVERKLAPNPQAGVSEDEQPTETRRIGGSLTRKLTADWR
jgi:hypothetical protein